MKKELLKEIKDALHKHDFKNDSKKFVIEMEKATKAFAEKIHDFRKKQNEC